MNPERCSRASSAEDQHEFTPGDSISQIELATGDLINPEGVNNAAEVNWTVLPAGDDLDCLFIPQGASTNSVCSRLHAPLIRPHIIWVEDEAA